VAAQPDGLTTYWRGRSEREARAGVGAALVLDAPSLAGAGPLADLLSRLPADARLFTTARFDADAEVELHLLLPPGTRPVAATWEGDEVAFDPVTVEQSVYADAAGPVRAGSEVEVRYVDA